MKRGGKREPPIQICLGDGQAEQEEKGKPGGREERPAIIRLLETLLLKNQTAREKERILQEEFAIPMTQKMEEEVEEMCNLSQGIENRGIWKGRELGLREGIQRGASQGYLSSLKSLMKTTGWPLERALAALEISGEEEKRFRKLLEEENEKGRKAVSQKRKMKRE